jgi:hypothetical protein
LLSPEPLVSAVPLLEVIKSITSCRDIPSYYLISCLVKYWRKIALGLRLL